MFIQEREVLIPQGFLASVSSRVQPVKSFFASQSLHNKKNLKKKSGDVSDEANFCLLFFAS
jgi:hypothetical protein